MTTIDASGLKPNTQYTFQVRGTGSTTTPWSQWWTFTTERDRLPPMPVTDIAVVYADNHGSDEAETTYWYDRDLKLTWKLEGQGDLELTEYQQRTYDFKGKWCIRLEPFTGDAKFIIVEDAVLSGDTYSWTLTEGHSRSIFGIYNADLQRTFGSPAFKDIQIFGIDIHGNPSYNGLPHADGPDYSETSVSYGKAVVNPPPDPIQFYTGETYENGVDFRGADLRVKWINTISSGVGKNVDADFIVIELQPSPDPPVPGYTPPTKQYIVNKDADEWVLPYDINKGTFATAAYPYGMPRFSVSIYAVDAFGQYSQPVSTTAVNLPPQDRVGNGNWLAKPGKYQGYNVNQRNSLDLTWVPEHIDGVSTVFYELIDGEGTPGIESDLSGFNYVAELYGDYMDVPVRNLERRWVKGFYVDVFGQRGPITQPLADWPVECTAAIEPDVVAPDPPYDCHTESYTDGDATFLARQLFTWMPQGDERVTGHKIRYGPYVNGEVIGKSAYTVDASRAYVVQVSGTTVFFKYDHNFVENDWVALVNYEPVEQQQKRQVKKVLSSKSVELTGEPFSGGTLEGVTDASYDGKPSLDIKHTALVRAGVILDLYPGTDYFYEICTEGRLGNLGNYTKVDNPDTGESDYDEGGPYFLTGGNRLVAQTPLEVGTVGDSLPIVGASVRDDGFEGTVRVELKDTNPVRATPVEAAMIVGQLISVRDCHENVNGRWRIKYITKVGADLPAITNRVLTSNVVTITTKSAHNLVAGQEVVINITSGASASVFNGTFTIIATPTSTTFTYAKTNANISTAAVNGTVTVPGAPNQWDITFKIVDIFKPRTSMKFVAATGRAMAVTFALGAQVDGYSNSGLYMDDSNMWLSSNGVFRAGTNYGSSAWQGFEWNPTTSRFNVSGSLTAKSGYFDGNVFIRENGALIVGAGADIHEDFPITVDANANTITFVLRTEPPTWEQNVVVKTQKKDLFTPTRTGVPYIRAADVTDSDDNVFPAITVSFTTVDSIYNNTYVNGKCFFGAWTGMDSDSIASYAANGQEVFTLTQIDDGSGNILSYGSIGGFQIFPDRLQSWSQTKNDGVGIAPGTNANYDLIWAGGTQGTTGSAKFRVEKTGVVWVGGNDNPGQINLGTSAYSGTMYVGGIGNSNSIKITGGAGDFAKIYGGTGTFGNTNTPIYYDSAGNFSISNAFEVRGSINIGAGDAKTYAFIRQGGNAGVVLPYSAYSGASTEPWIILTSDKTPWATSLNNTLAQLNSNDMVIARNGIFIKDRMTVAHTGGGTDTAFYGYGNTWFSAQAGLATMTGTTGVDIHSVGGNVEIYSASANSQVYIWHGASNGSIQMWPQSGDLNVVMGGMPQLAADAGRILMIQDSNSVIRKSSYSVADLATDAALDAMEQSIKDWANGRFQLK